MRTSPNTLTLPELLQSVLTPMEAHKVVGRIKSGSVRDAMRRANNGTDKDTAAYKLLCINELSSRYLSETLKKEGPLNSPKQTCEFLKQQLRDREREVFAIIYLDNRYSVIHYQELFYGTLNSASVYPREVVKAALQHNAGAVILAHNHPSGNPQPSKTDIELTVKLKQAFDLIQVSLLDHLVIGDGEFVSMSDRNLF